MGDVDFEVFAKASDATNLHTDKQIEALIAAEGKRQENSIELIASENYVSRAVMAAQGSCLTNKYAEGYPGKRYYGGCQIVDEVERLAISRLCKLYDCNYANVQPHSGSQANQAVFLALLQPGDTVLSMSLNSGGHLTHGAKPNLSGKWFNIVSYEVDPESYLIDYDKLRKQAHEAKPKLIIAGGSAYPRRVDFAKFRQIADEVGAYLLVDMAHFAGIVAAGLYENPTKFAHIVTSTTHKTLRGPRGGIILTNDEALAKKLNSAIFPGLQGGPLMHVIAAKAVAFGEALQPEFRNYMHSVLSNAKTLADTLSARGYKVITGGTDTHLLLVDLRPQKITGKLAEETLGEIGVSCNKNAVPFDTESPMITSGLRLGSPAATSRGFGKQEFHLTGEITADCLDAISQGIDIATLKSSFTARVHELCLNFPISKHRVI